jgi:hypothetical protein
MERIIVALSKGKQTWYSAFETHQNALPRRKPLISSIQTEEQYKHVLVSENQKVMTD